MRPDTATPARNAPALWIGRVDEFPEEARARAWSQILDDDERARNERYRHARDRVLHLTARLMTRTLLSRCCPEIDPHQWKFRPGPHGKPEIAWPEEHIARLHFNVSHTAGVVAVGLSEAAPVGVDIERLDREADFVGLARRFFAPEEAAAVTACDDPSRRAALFYRFWTLKEAYVKAIGKGLAHPLDTFWFSPLEDDASKPRLHLRTDSGETIDEPGWLAHVGRVGDGPKWIVSAVTDATKPATADWATFTYRFDA